MRVRGPYWASKASGTPRALPNVGCGGQWVSPWGPPAPQGKIPGGPWPPSGSACGASGLVSQPNLEHGSPWRLGAARPLPSHTSEAAEAARLPGVWGQRPAFLQQGCLASCLACRRGECICPKPSWFLCAPSSLLLLFFPLLLPFLHFLEGDVSVSLLGLPHALLHLWVTQTGLQHKQHCLRSLPNNPAAGS